MAFVSFLLFPPLLWASASAQIWNIDCGATTGFIETGTGQRWVGDADYIKSGVSYTVANTTDVETRLRTLRAFPKNRKNCYSIPVGAKTKIKVWVSFYYGNYDGRGKPPSIDLLLENTNWERVVTKMDAEVSWTVIYVAERKWTDICVGSVGDDQEPFVSSIQVVALAPKMYSKLSSGVSLYYPFSYAYALSLPSDRYLRYPDDLYDRQWHPNDSRLQIKEDIISYKNAGTVNSSACEDNPPAKLFDGAIAALELSGNLTIKTTLRPYTSGLYLNMYFTEVNSTATTKRMFDIYVADMLVSDSSNPIAPRLGDAIEFTYVTFEGLFANAVTLTLVPTQDSTLPPLICGFEALQTYGVSTASTNAADVEALSWLQGNFTALKNWTGDPCLPIKFNWEWVRCYAATTPRVTKLYLNGFGLSGDIPNFSGMDALRVIILQNNNLGGSVPEFLANFPLLEVLNLADNNFSSIPDVLLKNSKILVNVTGNPLLCGDGRTCIYGPFSPKASPPPPLSSGNAKAMTSSPSLVLLISTMVAMISL